MNHAEFNKLLNEIIERTTNVLAEKSNEYSTDTDKLHNFKVAARKRNTTPEDALLGMEVKHDVSLDDIVNKITKIEQENKKQPLCVKVNPVRWLKRRMLEEKITDSINYLILLEALIKERY